MTYAQPATHIDRRFNTGPGIIAGAGASLPGPSGLYEAEAKQSAGNRLKATFNGKHEHGNSAAWKPFGLTSSWWLKHADVKASPMWQVLQAGQGCRYIIEGRYKPVARPVGIVKIRRNQRYLGGGGEYDITGACPGATTIHAVDRAGTCVDELQVSVVQGVRRTLRFCFLGNDDGEGGMANGSTRAPAALAAVLREANGILGGWTGLQFAAANPNQVTELHITDSLARGSTRPAIGRL